MNAKNDWFNAFMEVEDYLMNKLGAEFKLVSNSPSKNIIAAIEQYASNTPLNGGHGHECICFKPDSLVYEQCPVHSSRR